MFSGQHSCSGPWTDATFNPWWGCTQISSGCDHCYAQVFDNRLGGGHWGKGAPRRIFSDRHWSQLGDTEYLFWLLFEPLYWDSAVFVLCRIFSYLATFKQDKVFESKS